MLTYTPDNPSGWQIEMGNVGQHYYQWLYGSIPSPVQVLASPSLSELANRKGVRVASQIVSYKLDDPTYTEAAREIANIMMIAGEIDARGIFAKVNWQTILSDWNFVSEQLGMGIIPYEDQLVWNSGADDLLTFANQYQMPVCAASLLWGGDIPNTVLAGGFTPDQRGKVAEFMVKARVLKYKGKINEWVVAGEVAASMLFGDATFKYWFADVGIQIVIDAFQWAKAADPEAKLTLIEDHILDANNSAFQQQDTTFWQLVKQLKQSAAPMDKIAFENNFWIYAPPEKQTMKDKLQRVVDLGYEIGIPQTVVAQSEQYPF